jgi:hypothetical protein
LEGAESLLEKGREERVGYWNLYGQHSIHNFGSKNENVAGAKVKGISHYDKCGGKKPTLYVMVFHMYNIKKLTVSMLLLLQLSSCYRSYSFFCSFTIL